MNIDLKGFHSQCKNQLMGGLIIHNDRCMTERETRIAVNYGIAMGYKLASEIPTEKIDEICNSHGNEPWMDQFDDTPEFVALPELERVIRKIADRYWRNNFDAEDLIVQIKEEFDIE